MSKLTQKLSSKYFILVCIVLGLILRLVWIYFIKPEPVSDFAWYFQRGTEISQGKGYIEYGEPTAHWPIGYPAFLGLLFYIFGPHLIVAKLANVALYVGSIYLSYYIAKKLFRSEMVGRVTALILTFYPNHIAYSSIIASEILSLFLLLLATAILVNFDLVHKKRKMLILGLSGITFGFLILTKPQTVFLPTLFFIVLFAKNQNLKRLKKIIVLVFLNLMALIVISPWLIRNYRVFNGFVFISTNSGTNLLIGNNPRATGRWINIFEKEKPLVDFSQTKNVLEKQKIAFQAAFNFIKNNPKKFIKLLPKKFKYLFNKDIEGIYWNEKGLKNINYKMQKFFQFFYQTAQLYYQVLLILSLAGLIISFIRCHLSPAKCIFPTLGIWLIIYITLVHLIFFGGSRFHFHLMPWIIMFSSIPIVIFLRKNEKSIN